MVKENILSKIKIYKKHDFELSDSEEASIIHLLSKMFPNYFQNRIFFKQIPTYRLIVEDEGKIIAQVGIDCRVIKASQSGILKTQGIIDLCVDPQYQGKGIASYLLKMIEDNAQKQRVDFIFLFADDHRIYQKNGYQRISVNWRFLAIEALTSVKVINKDLDSCFALKPISSHETLDGQHLDMLGYLY